MTDDLPLDLQQVAADDEAIEQLRNRSVAPDPALVLLRDLLADVDVDLPSAAPVGRGSTVLSLAGEQTPERRLARNGTVVALFTAGIVSLGGVAAASVLVPPGNPLHGLGETVRSVVTAIAPPQEVQERRTDTPAGRAAGSGVVPPRPVTPTAPPEVPAAARVSSLPGAGVSSAVRSQAAARQVGALLDAAAALLADRRLDAASARLDLAERRLADVPPSDRPALSGRLADLREQVAAARASDARTSRRPPKESSSGGKSSSRSAPAGQPAAVAPKSKARPAPAAPRADRVKPLGKPKAQLSRTASMKPRA